MTRYRVDPATEVIAAPALADPQATSIVLGGSPLRLFRVTPAGRARVESIVAGDDVTATPLVERLLDAGIIHPVAEPAHDRLADTTVVVVTYDGDVAAIRALVGRCRDAGAGKVIVVDDGSAVPVADSIAGDGDVLVVRHDTNRGPGAARNTGLATAETDYVLFLDDDVVLDATGADACQQWLAHLLGHFDDERLALVAPRVRSAHGDVIGTNPSRLLVDYERSHSPLDLGPRPALVRPGSRVGHVPAAALVVRRAALASIGGFDTELRYGEDVDAVWRLDEAGWRCRYEPDVVVEHRPRLTWGAWAQQRYHYGTSAAVLSERHPGSLAPVRMNGWTAAIWSLALLRRPVAAVGLAAWTVVALDRKVEGLGRRRAAHLATLGNVHAGRLIGSAVRRVWWPVVGVAALRSRRARWLAAISCVAMLFDRPTRLRHVPVRLADDVCYGAGVWAGVIRRRRPDPLVPDLAAWPSRSDAP